MPRPRRILRQIVTSSGELEPVLEPAAARLIRRTRELMNLINQAAPDTELGDAATDALVSLALVLAAGIQRKKVTAKK